MNVGTCSVCGQVFPLDENRNLAWHEYPDAPFYGLNHPRTHREDHCLGVHFPPMELSPKGAEECANTLEVLRVELDEELQQWQEDGFDQVFSERLGRYVKPGDSEFEAECRMLMDRRSSDLRLLATLVAEYRAKIGNWSGLV